MFGAAPRGQFYEKHIPEIFLRNVPQTRSKRNILQLGKGGPPHAPPARAAAVPASAGGCRPPTPPKKRNILLL